MNTDNMTQHKLNACLQRIRILEDIVHDLLKELEIAKKAPKPTALKKAQKRYYEKNKEKIKAKRRERYRLSKLNKI